MAINVVNALLTSELGLDTFKVTKAAMWDAQIKGAYSFLYPYIMQDFRHARDCFRCHLQTNSSYMADPPGKGGAHTMKPLPNFEEGKGQVNMSMHPIAKRGGENVGTYGA